ncbi:MAG: hypothetical protein HY248_05790 [Fimbriimonas ginsengisoli]|uniref:Uncharacterized protein n=1 Tax=Fimbriimonas ginsengisoli TaxID=1005039 RepID=A0A931LQF6_FIMGI|nr:hypothetical protein [Fimbriimonas ginsengisoli]MBI3722047.1 hypothetical protein [Fimbriimonas ginsengisoli]
MKTLIKPIVLGAAGLALAAGTLTLTLSSARAQQGDPYQGAPGRPEPPMGDMQRGEGQGQGMRRMGPGQMMGGPPPAAMIGDEAHLYVLLGDQVFKLSKHDLRVVAHAGLHAGMRPGAIPRGVKEIPPRFEGGGRTAPGDEPVGAPAERPGGSNSRS